MRRIAHTGSGRVTVSMMSTIVLSGSAAARFSLTSSTSGSIHASDLGVKARLTSLR